MTLQTTFFTMMSGLFLHHSGSIVPIGTKPCAAYATLSPPGAPGLSSGAGGASGAATYYARTSYCTAHGETTPSAEASLAVAAGALVNVASPSPVSGAVGWNLYLGAAAGAETRQNAVPIPLGQSWIMPSSGLVAGAVPPAVNSSGWEWCYGVPDVTPQPFYEASVIDTGFDDTLRVWDAAAGVMLPGQSGTPALDLEIDYWLSGSADSGGFTPWTASAAALRYVRSRLYVGVGGGISALSLFEVTVDRAPKIENSAVNVAVAPGGATIAFATPFHEDPIVICQAIGAAALSATAQDVTTMGFTVHVWDHSGDDVGGTISWTATGQ